MRLRLREKKYSDYGLTEKELGEIRRFCENPTPAQRNIIMDAAVMANPYIAIELYNSLVHKQSYTTQANKKYIPFGEKDFYAYRRLAMAILFGFMNFGLERPQE